MLALNLVRENSFWYSCDFNHIFRFIKSGAMAARINQQNMKLNIGKISRKISDLELQRKKIYENVLQLKQAREKLIIKLRTIPDEKKSSEQSINVTLNPEIVTFASDESDPLPSDENSLHASKPRVAWTLMAEWGYGHDGFHGHQEPEKWMVGVFSSREIAISKVEMVMEEIFMVGDEWRAIFEIQDNSKKGGEGVIMTAEADDSPSYTISLYKAAMDEVQPKEGGKNYISDEEDDY